MYYKLKVFSIHLLSYLFSIFTNAVVQSRVAATSATDPDPEVGKTLLQIVPVSIESNIRITLVDLIV